jgi:hypothetical protein
MACARLTPARLTPARLTPARLTPPLLQGYIVGSPGQFAGQLHGGFVQGAPAFFPGGAGEPRSEARAACCRWSHRRRSSSAPSPAQPLRYALRSLRKRLLVPACPRPQSWPQAPAAPWAPPWAWRCCPCPCPRTPATPGRSRAT